MTLVLTLLVVALGGAAGAVARWGIGEGWRRWRERENRPSLILDLVPWPTFAANVLGSFFLGVVVTLVGSASEGPALFVFLLLATGFCAALSTLSTAALEIVEFARRRTAVIGIGYLLLSVGAGMGALWLGLVISS